MREKTKGIDIAVKCAFTDMVPTDEVKPHPKNPNKHPPKQIALLARMMRRWHWRQFVCPALGVPVAH